MQRRGQLPGSCPQPGCGTLVTVRSLTPTGRCMPHAHVCAIAGAAHALLPAGGLVHARSLPCTGDPGFRCGDHPHSPPFLARCPQMLICKTLMTPHQTCWTMRPPPSRPATLSHPLLLSRQRCAPMPPCNQVRCTHTHTHGVLGCVEGYGPSVLGVLHTPFLRLQIDFQASVPQKILQRAGARWSCEVRGLCCCPAATPR